MLYTASPDTQSQRTRYIPKDARSVKEVLTDLLTNLIVLPEDWDALDSEVRETIRQGTDVDTGLDRLVAHNLLTDYQANRVRAGTTFGLILGNYRVLERIGAGGMAVVFKGEHM